MSLFDINNNIKKSASKASPVDADYLVGWDSEGFAGKRITVSALSTKVQSDLSSGIVTTSISTGVTPADLTIDCGTEKTLVLAEPVWDDLRIPITSTKLGGSKDPDFAQFIDDAAGTSQGLFIEWFDKTAEEEVYFTAQLPHGYKLGTDLEFHVHWVPAANGAENATVSWGLEYAIAIMGGTYTNSTIIYTKTHYPADASLVANKHYLSDFATIDGSGITSVSAMILGRLFRDAPGNGQTDDYDNDAGVLEADFHFQIDTLGSRQEAVK